MYSGLTEPEKINSLSLEYYEIKARMEEYPEAYFQKKINGIEYNNTIHKKEILRNQRRKSKR